MPKRLVFGAFAVGMILAAGFVASRRARDVREVVGFTDHPNCHACTTKNFDFYECLHTSPTGPCDVTKCIHNIIIYAACQSGAPGGEDPHCVTTYNANAQYGAQLLYQSAVLPLNCQDNGMQLVPN